MSLDGAAVVKVAGVLAAAADSPACSRPHGMMNRSTVVSEVLSIDSSPYHPIWLKHASLLD